MPRYANPFSMGRYPVNPGWSQLGSVIATALFGDPQARAAQEQANLEQKRVSTQIDYNNERTRDARRTNDAMDRIPSALGGIFQGGMGGGLVATPEQRAETERLTAELFPNGVPPELQRQREAESPLTAMANAMMPEMVMPAMPSTGMANVFVQPPAAADPLGAIADSVSPPAQPAAARRARTVDDVTGLVRAIAPGAQITSTVRDPNSALGRANPRSFHNVGRAIDMADIPGMTMQQMADRLRGQGLNIVEAIDEYTNPSRHSTGGHWHFAWSDEPGATPASTGGSAAPQPTGVAQAMVGDPTYIPEPQGRQVDLEALPGIVGLLIQAGIDNPAQALAAITGYSGDDRTARGALISMGRSPDEDFAATRERADNIFTRNAQSELVRAIATANLDEMGATLRNDADNATSIRNNEADNQISLANNAADNQTSRANNADDNAAAAARDAADRAAGGGGRGRAATRPDAISAADSEAIVGALADTLGDQWTNMHPERKAILRRTAEMRMSRYRDSPMNAAQQAIEANERARGIRPRRTGAAPAAPTAPPARTQQSTVIRYDSQGNRIP